MEPSMITSMSSVERRYFEEVSNQCNDDVKRLCGRRTFPSTVVSSFSSSPINNMMMDDFGSVVDEFMRQVMEFPSLIVDPPHEPWNELSVSNAQTDGEERGLESPDEPNAAAQEDNNDEGFPVLVFHSSFSPCEEQLVRHMLSQFVPLIAPEEATDLARKISDHGHVLLQRLPDDEDNQEFRVARRLSEVTPEEVMEHRRTMFLPFGSDKNECLVQAYRNFRLTAPCGLAIQNLEHVRAAQHHLHMHQRQVSLNACMDLFLMYFLVLAAVIVLFLRRKNLFKVKRHLASSIFRTIYSRPELKRALEKELGHSIGNDMPRPWRAMKHGVQKLRNLLCVLAMISFLCMLDLVSVTTALRVGVLLALFVFLRVIMMKPAAEEASCSCCCCSACPGDAEAGLLTVEQACCGSCQGTGVCCAKCASCCGTPDKMDGCGGCCSGGSSPECGDKDASGCCDKCCCCSGGSSPGCCNKESGVACCENCCCCSGGSSPGANSTGCGCSGNCSGCCQKSGVACCENCCCCNPSSPDKKVYKPRHEIYEGIPIQIV